MSQIEYNPQQQLEYSVQPPGKITSDQIARETQQMMYALAVKRRGTQKPQDIKDGEFWCKDLPDGSFQIYRWVTASGDADGIFVFGGYATDAQLETGVQEELEKLSINAWQHKRDLASIDLSSRADLTLSNVTELSPEFQALLPNSGGEDFITDYYPKTDAEKASANGRWWETWNSGKIRQSGPVDFTTTTNTVQLLKPMTTTAYFVSVRRVRNNATYLYDVHITTRATTNFKVYDAYGGAQGDGIWIVEGY